MQLTDRLTAKVSSDILTKARLNKGKTWLWAIFRLFLFIGIGYVILYPILYMLSTTFRSDADILDPSIVWIPKHFSLNNIKQAFDVMEYPKALANTAGINMVAALLQVAVTSVVGYGFARYKFRGRSLLFGLVLFTIIVPPQTTMIPMFLKFSNFDVLGIAELTRTIFGMEGQVKLINTPFVMYLPALFGMGIRSGLFIYIFRQSFRGMPKELEEAALIDGCGYRKTFFRIMLPNARTSLLVFFLFSLVWYWSDYYLASINLSSVQTLATRIVDLRYALEVILPREHFTVYYIIPIEQAACVFSIAPLILLFLVGQRFFVQGIDRTGIVG